VIDGSRVAAALGCRLDAEAALHRHRHALTERHVSLRPSADGMAWLSALLPLREAVTAWKHLTQTADTARASGDERTRGQLMADTLTDRLLARNSHDQVHPDVRLHLVMTDIDLTTGTGVAWLEGEPLPGGVIDDLLARASVSLR